MPAYEKRQEIDASLIVVEVDCGAVTMSDEDYSYTVGLPNAVLRESRYREG